MNCGFISYHQKQFWALSPHKRMAIQGEQMTGRRKEQSTPLALVVLSCGDSPGKARPVGGAGGCRLCP